MIGLELILKIKDIEQLELAEELGIKKQNITLWLSGKQSISKKYLPILSKKFETSEEFLQNEISQEKVNEIKETVWEILMR